MKFVVISMLLVLTCAPPAYMQTSNANNVLQGSRDSVYLGHIIFEGNKKTKESVLLRELNTAAGDKIALKEMEDLAEVNCKRLMNLSLFSEATVTKEWVNDSTVDWKFKVREQWFIMPELGFKLADRNINVWWREQHHDFRRANLTVLLKHRNLRGRMEQLSATIQVGYTQKLGLEYFRPYIDKKQQNGLGASFFFAKNYL